MKTKVDGKTLVLMPETDLVASSIEDVRDYCLAQLEENPDVSKVVLDVEGIEFVDSLGVNFIVGLYRQVASEEKNIEINGAGKSFMKVANFFRFPSLFPVNSAN